MRKHIFPHSEERTVKRAIIIMVTFLLIAIYLTVNVFYLALFKYDYYKNKAFDQITTTSSLKAKRGTIYDSSLNILATSATNWRIFTSPRELASNSKKDGVNYLDVLCEALPLILNIDKEALSKKLCNTSALDVTIKRAATESEYNAVRAFINDKGLEKVLFTEAQNSRQYPEGTLAAHVLGFSGSDGQGLYGLEYYYDSTLKGVDGYYLYAKDANGHPMPDGYTSYEAPKDGNSIVTTIDSYIQSELEHVLETILINHDVNNRVCGIVMDTKTGAILAMATSSPFDPNDPFILDDVSLEKLKEEGFIEGTDEYNRRKLELMQIMWSNKAVSETYEPGSTFKIVTVSAALDSGVSNENDRYSCPGFHIVGGRRIKCHKTTGHGSGFTLAYGLQVSCNPTMMKVAEKIGVDRFYSYVESFGYFEKTGIDLPSEASTIFHKKENMGSTELATASFGQRFKVSIISQLSAVAAVANGGKLVTPYVVDKIIDADGNIISSHSTDVKRQVISETTAKTVSEILEKGVSGDGGAKNAAVDGYKIAAKTGTSQKFDILDSNGNSYLRIGSTVAYAPSDEGGIAMILVVDEPQSTVKYGSFVAAPYISDLMEKILPYLEYESSSTKTAFTVENYVGMNINTVKNQLKDNSLQYKVIGNGNVVLRQSPGANVDITKEMSVIVLYTSEEGSDIVEMPDVTGLKLTEANKVLSELGINIKIRGISDERGRALNVLKQSIPPNTKIRAGEVVVIDVFDTEFQD